MSKLLNGGCDVEVHATTAQGIKCYTISKVKKTGELETVLKVILDSIDASSNMWTRTDPRHIHSQIDVNIERDRPQILGYLTSIDNSLAILRPDVASKWDYVKNQDLTPDM